MSEKWSKEFDSCFQVGSIEEIADALEKRSAKHRIVTQMTINIIKNVRCGIIAPPLPYGGYRATIMLSRHYSRALG